MGGTERFQENGIIQIENLVKRYGSFVALDHLNLNVREGEIFGLLGPNGSGKTTVINCMLALLKYDKGSIRIFGQEMAPDHYEVKKQIGIILQNVAVFDELTVYENIDYFCGLYVKEKEKRKTNPAAERSDRNLRGCSLSVLFLPRRKRGSREKNSGDCKLCESAVLHLHSL